MPEKQKPVYVTPDGDISFFENPRDSPGAYLVDIKNIDTFYIPSEMLEDLTRPEYSTENIARKIGAIGGAALPLMHKRYDDKELILQNSGVSTKDVHLALLQLRVQEQEKKLHDLYSKVKIS